MVSDKVFSVKYQYIKYFLLAIATLVFIGYVYISKTGADTTPVFQRWIGGPISGPTRVGVQNLDYPQAIVIDSSGNKFFTAGNAYNTVIFKYDANDNFVMSFGESGTSTGEMSYIERLAIDAQDNIYATDCCSKVLKFDNNGNFLFEFGSYDAGNGNGKFQYPDSVAINPVNNYIYVSDYYRNDIQVFDTNGNYVEKFGGSGSGDGQFSCPYGITFDPNNDIYVADTCHHRIQKFASSTHTFLSKFGTQGSGDGQFYYPYNLVIDSHGDLLVNDANNNRVQKFSSTTHAFISSFSTLSNGYGDIAVDTQNNVYVAAQSSNKLVKYDSSGNLIKSYSSAGNSDGEFDWPIGIAIDSDKNIYITDDRNSRIQKFDSNGNFILKFGSLGNGAGQFVDNNSMNGIEIDGQGDVYISNPGSDRVQKYDSSGNFLFQFGSLGFSDGQFNDPADIAIDLNTNNVYVVEELNHRVSVFDSAGNFLFKFGTFGSGDGQFNRPMGITITSQGYVYVAQRNDSLSNIQKFDLNGNYISKFGSAGSGDGQFSFYTYLSYLEHDASGNIYVADYNNQRIQKFDSNGNFVSKFSTADKGIRPLGIARDSAGTFYITGLFANSAAIYAPTPLLITSVSSSVSTSSATITWTSSEAASSQVEYGPTTSFGTSTVETNTSPRVTNHSVTLNNLPTCTTFYYRVKSINDSAVTTLSTSTSFTTAGCTANTTVESTASVAASSTATSTVSNTSLALSIPPNVSSTSTDIVFQANKIEPVTFFAVANTPTGKTAVSSEVFHLTAIDNTNNSVISTFTNPILVSITYSSLNGIDPNTLSIYRYDGSSWFPLSNCSTNTNTNTVSCYTTQFSDFALFAVPKPAGGAAYYQVPGDIDTYKLTTQNTVSNIINPTEQIVNQVTTSISTSTIKFSRALYRGLSGKDVSLLQTILSTRYPNLYSKDMITGYFGNYTLSVVRKIQCQYNIVCEGGERSTGWGRVGPKTQVLFR
jgi:DNA-binding beta-propeller fold protein YncE